MLGLEGQVPNCSVIVRLNVALEKNDIPEMICYRFSGMPDSPKAKEFLGHAFKPGIEARVWFCIPDTPAELLYAPAELLYAGGISYDDLDAAIKWTVSKKAKNTEDLFAFLAEWIPKSPDPDLFNKAAAKLPTGVL
jgi:hypothetical protein